jgi:predicted double-glycine peptidase
MASPSLIADIAVLLLPLLAGALCFAGAERMVRAPWAARVGLWLVWAGLAGTTIVYYADAGPTWLQESLSLLGGVVVLAGWLILVVLGFHAHRSSSSPTFRGFLLGLTLLLMGVESCGRLWYGWQRTDMWTNHPSGDGLIQQSSSITCGPCTAAMLLHDHGINVSEGELAYLMKSSPLFGTREHSMAWGLNQYCLCHGLQAHVLALSEPGVQRLLPCITFLRIGKVGVHAVVLERIDPATVTFRDPIMGQRRVFERVEFERIWTRRGICLISPSESRYLSIPRGPA